MHDLLFWTGTLAFAAGLSGLVSGLGGKFWFVVPVYTNSGLRNAYNKNNQSITDFGKSAWYTGYNLWEHNTFGTRLWALYPNWTLDTVGLASTQGTDSPNKFGGFAKQGTKTTFQDSWNAANSLETPVKLPYGPLGEYQLVYLNCALYGGLFLMLLTGFF